MKSANTLTARMISRLTSPFKPYQRSTVLYIVAFLLFFAVICVAALPIFFHKALTSLIIFQGYFLLLGCFHVFFLTSSVEWSGEQSFAAELLFTLLISFFGYLIFLLAYHWFNNNGMEYLMSSAIILFLIPFFFYHTFKKAIAIPPKIRKQWFYPVPDEIEAPDYSTMKKLLVVSFKFQKSSKDQELTNFHANAPGDIEFGKLFYFFINDYNEVNSESKIQYFEPNGKSQGWIFYKKPKWYSFATKYIDTDKTVFANKIYENDVIICERSQI